MRGLGETPLPLFAAADAREAMFSPESIVPIVALTPMSDGREVVEDCRSLALSLRAHPLTFLRDDLTRRGIARCADLAQIKEGRHVEVAGIVLVRQKPDRPRAFYSLPSRTKPASPMVSSGRTGSRRSGGP